MQHQQQQSPPTTRLPSQSTAAPSATLASVDFTPLLRELEADRALLDAIRDESRALDQIHRSLASHLNRAHSIPSHLHAALLQPPNPQTPSPLAPLLSAARLSVARIRDLVPAHQFWRCADAFNFALQRIASDVLLAFFLGTHGLLMSKQECCAVLDIRPEHASQLMLTNEDYLHALITMINELSRLAVNSVTLGDFGAPLRLSAFVKELHAGFQLLNLKNDALRKRFDSIKYDVKRIEEVVYDISLRGLLPNTNTTTSTSNASATAGPGQPPSTTKPSETALSRDEALAVLTRAAESGAPAA